MMHGDKMINFVICEDNKDARCMYESVVLKTMMLYDFPFVVHSFDKYNSDLKEMINTPSDKNVYLLDIELPGKSGIDIARQIRKTDWDSPIIILTSHDELELKVLREKLLILDFISKFEDLPDRLSDTLKLIFDQSNDKNILTFKSNKEIHKVKMDNILYILRDTYEEKVKIVTVDKEYLVRENLHNIVERLDSRFKQSHRSCYVNIKNIKSVDFKNSIIEFNNGYKVDYLSRNCKKELRSILCG